MIDESILISQSIHYSIVLSLSVGSLSLYGSVLHLLLICLQVDGGVHSRTDNTSSKPMNLPSAQSLSPRILIPISAILVQIDLMIDMLVDVFFV